MSNRILRKPVALAIGAALATSLAAAGAAQASSFAVNVLGAGYMLAAGEEKAKEGKCGEGKCGGDNKKAEGKCGEGKCGADKKEEEKPKQ